VNNAFLSLFFRRMRVPLVVLISAYAIATVGFTLMPGVDDQGNPWRLSLFEAFYVVSYTGSTIGFGEVPYAFSPAQRLWTMVSIYLTVVAWLFSIGTIVSLLQDPAFRNTLKRQRFGRAVRKLERPFYLICGYGDTGRLLTRALSDQGHPVVVLDHNPDKMEALTVEVHAGPVISLCVDARLSDHLVEAGLRSRWCMGVMAVTGDDSTNLKIAVTTKLLNQRCAAHARADLKSVADNMRSFDTDHVINPVEEYVRRLRLAFERPSAFRLYHWLQSGPQSRLPEFRRPPRGRWVLCGFGRLGRAAHAMLVELGLEVTVIEEDPSIEGLPSGAIQGRGTQAETLEAAGIESAVGILATTRDDVDNLSILMTARQLNPELFFGALENGLSSHALFRAAAPDLIGQPSTVIAGTILNRLRSPLAAPFFDQLLASDDALAAELLERLVETGDPRPPALFTLRISDRRAPALARLIEQGMRVRLGELCRDPARPARRLALEPLLLLREDDARLLPGPETELELGDRLLLAGDPDLGRPLRILLDNENILARRLTGRDPGEGWLWQRLVRLTGGAGKD
jgi:voltage-gated potassium channel